MTWRFKFLIKCFLEENSLFKAMRLNGYGINGVTVKGGKRKDGCMFNRGVARGVLGAVTPASRLISLKYILAVEQ